MSSSLDGLSHKFSNEYDDLVNTQALCLKIENENTERPRGKT
jgi:hypothetical protein